jgi:hypothetical protein
MDSRGFCKEVQKSCRNLQKQPLDSYKYRLRQVYFIALATSKVIRKLNNNAVSSLFTGGRLAMLYM